MPTTTQPDVDAGCGDIAHLTRVFNRLLGAKLESAGDPKSLANAVLRSPLDPSNGSLAVRLAKALGEHSLIHPADRMATSLFIEKSGAFPKWPMLSEITDFVIARGRFAQVYLRKAGRREDVFVALSDRNSTDWAWVAWALVADPDNLSDPLKELVSGAAQLLEYEFGQPTA